jgi:DNA-directed RNA polymerase, beta'' subunit/160 kD subunit
MLDMSARQLERVIYYEDYIVIDPGKTPLQKTQLLNEVEYREAQEQYGEDFVAGMGAEAIKKLLPRSTSTSSTKSWRKPWERRRASRFARNWRNVSSLFKAFRVHVRDPSG